MNSRTNSADSRPLTPGRLVPWALLALGIVAAIVLAIRYGSRVTPLFDTVR